MSVIGISPTDIVKTVAVGYKTAKALRSGDDGAQTGYQHAKRAIAYRIRALEDLHAATSTVLPSFEDSTKVPLNEDEAFQRKISSYEEDLGRGAQHGKRHGIKSKIKFAFQGEKEVQNHLDSSRASVDAAIFGNMR